MTMKLTMKKFHLISKYANYSSWDENQNKLMTIQFQVGKF